VFNRTSLAEPFGSATAIGVHQSTSNPMLNRPHRSSSIVVGLTSFLAMAWPAAARAQSIWVEKPMGSTANYRFVDATTSCVFVGGLNGTNDDAKFFRQCDTTFESIYVSGWVPMLPIDLTLLSERNLVMVADDVFHDELEATIIKSTDGGQTWVATYRADSTRPSLRDVTSKGDMVLVGGAIVKDHETGRTTTPVLMLSNDAGLTWSRVDGSLPDSVMVLSSAIVDARTWMVSGRHGDAGQVWITRDSGATWTSPVRIDGEPVHTVKTNGIIAVAVSRATMFVSIDGGTSWRTIRDGFGGVPSIGDVELTKDGDIAFVYRLLGIGWLFGTAKPDMSEWSAEQVTFDESLFGHLSCGANGYDWMTVGGKVYYRRNGTTSVDEDMGMVEASVMPNPVLRGMTVRIGLKDARSSVRGIRLVYPDGTSTRVDTEDGAMGTIAVRIPSEAPAGCALLVVDTGYGVETSKVMIQP